MLNLKKAVWVKTSRCSEQPLSRFVTHDKSKNKTKFKKKEVKSLVFFLALTGRNHNPNPQTLHPSPCLHHPRPHQRPQPPNPPMPLRYILSRFGTSAGR